MTANQPARGGGPGYSRSRHRAASHDSAHAQGASHTPDEIPAHPLIPRGPGELVTTNQALTDLLSHLREVGQFAYDSEFIGEMSYHPRLCLIQVATSQKIYLIDPQTDVNLIPFWELLCDPAVEKTVHAGEQDLEPVVRHLGRQPTNFLDTQISAGFVGMAYPVALSKLVLEVTGAKLGKGLTFTDWSQRPLSAVQQRYAADDVRYLPAIREMLGKKLEELGHLAWAKAESESLGEPSRFIFDPSTDYLRVRGAGGLPPQNLAVLRELTAWRDAAAQSADSPPRAYLKDEILIDMARSPVKSVDKLSRVRNLPRPVESEHGETIVAATMRGLAMSVDELPSRQVEPTPTQRFGADGLWAATQCLCSGRLIDPNLIVSRQDIGELYRHLTNGTDPSELRIMRGWRREAVGETLLNLFNGKTSFDVSWSDGEMRSKLR